MKNLVFCFGKTKIYTEYNNSKLLHLKKGCLLFTNLEDIAWFTISKYFNDKNSRIKKNSPYITNAFLLPNEEHILTVQNLYLEFQDGENKIKFDGYKILYNLNMYFISCVDNYIEIL